LSKLNKLSLKTPHDYLIIMKLSIPTIGVLSAVALLVSVGAIYAVSYELELSPNANPSGGAFMIGNVKVTHFDQDGQVIGYRYGTNHITGTGMVVIMGQVFRDVNSTLTPANSTGRVQWMEIGTEGDPVVYANALRWNDTDINTPVGNACIRIDATITNTTFLFDADRIGYEKSPGTCAPATVCSAQMNVTAVAQFQGSDCSAIGIDEAGIFTASTAEAAGGTGGLMFARNVFGSVNLGALDTLQLEWEFTFTDS